MRAARLGLAGLLATGAALAQEPSTPAQIAVRLPTQASRAVQDALLQVALPTEVTIPAGTNPTEALRAHCGGSFSDAQLADLRRLNGNAFVVAPQPQERTGVKLPPCPQVQRLRNDGTARVSASPGDDLALLVAREMGAGLDERIEVTCAEGVSAQRRGAGCTIPLRDAILRVNGQDRRLLTGPLAAGTPVQLPAVSRWTTLTVRPGVEAEAARTVLASAILGATRQTANIAERVALVPDIRLVEPLADTEMQGTLCDAALAPPPGLWPMRLPAFRDALREAMARAEREGTMRTRGEVVRVADTGFDEVLERFGPALLAADPGWAPGAPPPPRPPFADFQGTHFGFTPERNGRIASPPFEQAWRRLHGLQVADLAIGGAGLRAEMPELGRLVRLTFARLWRDSPPGFAFDMDTLTFSVRFVPPQPRVLNLSLGGSGAMGNFEQILRTHPMLLVVVAAGNVGQNLDRASPRIFPASYGHQTHALSGQIVVVAGHTPGPAFPEAPDPKRHFQLVPRSNFGPEIVDLLAPGCLIPSSIAGEQQRLHGTSFAAPVVSLTAAALASLGLETPQELKTRLVASADYLPWLEEVTRFAAVVNPERAVRLFETTARLVDGREIAGDWQEQGTTIEVCQGNDKFRDGSLVRRIDVLPQQDGRPPRLRILMSSAPDAYGLPILNAPCVAAAGGITLTEPGREPSFVPWAELRSVVPAFIPRRLN